MVRSEDDAWDVASSVGATATMVAAGRAMATKESRAGINDPFAEPLVEAVGLEFFTKQVKGEMDTGAMQEVSLAFVQLMVDGIAVRTKYFDQYFADAVDTGIRQVVILASGLDARAYRLPWPAGTVVYEIDQPKVIAFKMATLADLGAEPTAEHRTVQIDLREDWPAALRARGFDTNAPTAWFAEGLLQYLSADAQNLLLDNITDLSAAGSTFAADYIADMDDPGQLADPDISENWREKGFTLDMPSLMFAGERSDAAGHLTTLGWQSRRQSVDVLFTAYGIERARTVGNHPLDEVVYVGATLNQTQRVSA
jgi:methyltransferase (TIGR00027 family)